MEIVKPHLEEIPEIGDEVEVHESTSALFFKEGPRFESTWKVSAVKRTGSGFDIVFSGPRGRTASFHYYYGDIDGASLRDVLTDSELKNRILSKTAQHFDVELTEEDGEIRLCARDKSTLKSLPLPPHYIPEPDRKVVRQRREYGWCYAWKASGE